MRDNIRALGQYAALPASEGGAGLSEADASQLVSAFFRALEDFDLLLYNAVREYKQQQQKADKDSGKVNSKAAATDEDDDGDDDAAAPGAAVVDPAVGLDKQAAAEKLQVAVAQLDKLIATVPADVRDRSQQVLDKVSGRKVVA